MIPAKMLVLVGSLAGCAMIVGTTPRVVGDASVDASIDNDCGACECHARCEADLARCESACMKECKVCGMTSNACHDACVRDQ